ncbi:MAG: FtsX-like permease family protein, partial [Nitrosomonas sp.]
MNLLRLSLRMLLRDWRAGELRILVLALIIAVSGVTTVGFFADRVQRALVRESSQLLGGDLLVNSSQVLPAEYEQQARRFRLQTVALTRFPSMVSYADNNLLCAIKAVAPGYPLRGKLQLAALPEDGEPSRSPERVAQGIPAPGTVWIDEKIMVGLDVKLGDKLEIGMIELTVTELVANEPDHSVGFINMNPRLLINAQDLAASELIQTGSRVSYQLLVAGEMADVAAYRSWLEPQLAPGESVEGIQDARPEIRAALDRAGKFLGLAALASVVVAAVAVALATRRFIQRHLDGCAVMRCLGATQSVLLRLYLYHFLMLGTLASLLGCTLGIVAQEFLSRWLAELAGTVLPLPGSLPAVQGMLTGMALLLGFSLPPLLNLRQVPALRVIRRDMDSVNLHGFAGYVFGLIMLSILFIWKAGDVKLGLLIMLGFLLAIVVFATIGWVIIRLMLLMRAQGSGAWHYGLANVK